MGIFLAFSLLTALVAVLYWVTKEKVAQQETSNGKLSMLTDLMKGLQSQVGEDKQGWILNTITVLTFLCVLQFGLHFMWPHWYAQHWRDGWLVFTEIAAGIGFAMRVREPNAKPMRHLVGTTILAIVLLVTVRNTFFPPSSGPEKPDSSTNAQAATSRHNAIVPPTEVFDEECKARASILNKEMREKIKVDFKDQPMMIPVGCRESGFNQTKLGTTEVLKGEQDPNDHGIFQINLTNHAAKIAELKLDVDKYEGQVAYVRYLLSTPQGIDHWFPEVSGRWYAPITLSIPVTKEWSPFVQIPKLTKEAGYLINNNKPILAEIDGKEVVFDPNIEIKWGAVRNIRFKSIEGNGDTTVTIPMKFWPVP